jgi:hypothetical protein
MQQKLIIYEKFMEDQKTMTQAEIGLWAKDTFGLESALRQSTIGGIIKEAISLISLSDMSY